MNGLTMSQGEIQKMPWDNGKWTLNNLKSMRHKVVLRGKLIATLA